VKRQVENVLNVTVEEAGKMAYGRQVMVLFRDFCVELAVSGSVKNHIKNHGLLKIANYAL
jgi:hypothetical protein